MATATLKTQIKKTKLLLRRVAQWKTRFGCPSLVSREKWKADLFLLRKSYRMSSYTSHFFCWPKPERGTEVNQGKCWRTPPQGGGRWHKNGDVSYVSPLLVNTLFKLFALGNLPNFFHVSWQQLEMIGRNLRLQFRRPWIILSVGVFFRYLMAFGVCNV